MFAVHVDNGDDDSFVHLVDPDTAAVVWCSEATPIVVDGTELPLATCPHTVDVDGVPLVVHLNPPGDDT